MPTEEASERMKHRERLDEDEETTLSIIHLTMCIKVPKAFITRIRTWSSGYVF